MSDSIVKVNNLVKRYKEKIAVDNFSFELKQGEILGLLGPNGSGKTTTINCILSLLSFNKGEIMIFDKNMSPKAYDIKSKIGVVPQNVAIMNTLNVYENVDFFCGLYIKDKSKRRRYVEEALEFTGLSDYKKYKPKKLSGGLLRRLNIACGIAHKPSLIIFDEPTVAVDPQSRNAILEGIKEMEEVEEICSRIIIMDHGKKVAEGTANDLKNSLKIRESICIGMPAINEDILKDIKGINHVYDAKYSEGELVISLDGGEHNLVHVLEYFSEKNIPFGHVQTKLPTLNDVFLEITGKELRD